MKLAIAFILFTVFLLLSLIHFYWGLGGKWGGEAALPAKENEEKVMSPGPLECFAVAIGLLLFALFCLVKGGVISFRIPGWLLSSGLWILTGIFVLRAVGDFKYVGFFKKIKATKFGRLDTQFYSPLCLAIGALSFLLEVI